MAAFTYPRSEPGSAGHLDLVEALRSHDLALRSALAGVPAATLEERPKEGEWSIKETVAHLCHVSHILHNRLQMMIRLEEPRLQSYESGELDVQREAQRAVMDDLLHEFSAQRAATVEMLADLVHWNWARTGRHPRLGRLSIRQQVELWIAHEAEHLQSVQEAAAR